MADNAISKLAQMRATPRNKLMGLLADSLGGVRDYANAPDPTMPGGLANPPLSMLSNLLSLPSLATTADRASYGEPLTNAGKANVPFLKPETADALMMAPLSPRAALGAAGLAAGIGDTNALRAATVWHGSPHKFDKFDASKIGTGEGAQAYGHGMYLAESKGVAQSYKDKLSPDTITRVKNDVYNIAGEDNHILTIYDANGKATKTPYLSPNELEKWVGKDTADMLRTKGDGDYKGLNVDFGNLYKVDLPDNHIANMLDWDKPLSQQAPGVQAIMQERGLGYMRDIPHFQGNTLHGYLGDTDAARASALRQAGIPGIRYLDGGSRAAGQGSSNYVIFPGNENILSILARNGVPVGK